MPQFAIVTLIAVLIPPAPTTLPEDAKPKSGPTVGTAPRVFYVKDCTGKYAKEIKTCYRCNYGIRPVVGVFGRELDQNTVKLLQALDKQLDAQRKVEKSVTKQMAGFFVMMTDNPDSGAAKLKRLQRKLKLRNVPLTVFDGTNGPPGYHINKKTAVTVSMWVRSAVKVNHAFKAGAELKPDAIKKVLASTQKIAPIEKKRFESATSAQTGTDS